jgi:DNA-nicking Smr family endonuclease
MPDTKPQPPPTDDIEVFLEAVGDVEPLQQDRTEPFRRSRKPVPIEQEAQSLFEGEFADRQIQTGDELWFLRPGLQRRVFQELRRGRITPEATLDLHGLRVEEARQALQRFLAHALSRGFRCLRVIHGKGKRTGDSQPVLKQKVDQWLPQCPAVLAVCSAPSWDGGTGAAYVLLARPHTRGESF